MKPRVFVGSSVEGLSVAYAIQTNLMHDCELTVWSQGAFEISKTTIESLMELLNSVDFALFVFTQDDILEIRDNRTYTVRDNVLFEFGLFLGKLGWERVFFVKPADLEIHLPTDLLGMTPAQYESNRADGNLVAATGPACHELRQLIKKNGSLQVREEISTVAEVKEEIQDQHDWLDDFIEKRYEQSKNKLDKLIAMETDEKNIIDHEYWKRLCEYRMDENKISLFMELRDKYPDNFYAWLICAQLHFTEGYFDQAILITEEAQLKFGNSARFIRMLAKCQLSNGDKDAAIIVLEDELTYLDPNAIIEYSNIYIDDKNYEKAREILHKGYLKFPKNALICSTYGAVARDLSEEEVSLFLYDKVSKIEPMVYSHISYMGNACHALGLHDISLSLYQKAAEMSNEKEAWVLSNIGNLLRNRGLYKESIKYLRQSLAISESDYALDRLAGAIKNKDEEESKYTNLLKEGQKKLKEYTVHQISNTSSLESVAELRALE